MEREEGSDALLVQEARRSANTRVRPRAKRGHREGGAIEESQWHGQRACLHAYDIGCRSAGLKGFL